MQFKIEIGIILVLLFFSSFQCNWGTYKPIPPELKNKIVFLCSGSICTINSDGTDLKVILPSERNGPFSNPQWSPDKQKIACTGQNESKRKRIVLVNADGSDERIIDLPGRTKNFLTSLGQRVDRTQYDLQFLGWSHSGKYLIYNEYGANIDGVSFGLMTTKGKPATHFRGSNPSFGGDDILIYEQSRGSVFVMETDIIRFDLKANRKESLIHSGDGRPTGYIPCISPDGRTIAYGSEGADQNVLWIMNSDGSNKRKLVDLWGDLHIGGMRSLCFSPNGNKIMFISDGGNRSQIYVINPDGTGLRTITSRIVNETKGASWSPDGKRIIFTSDKDGNDELYLVNVNGTGLIRLTNNSSEDCCPDWR